MTRNREESTSEPSVAFKKFERGLDRLDSTILEFKQKRHNEARKKTEMENRDFGWAIAQLKEGKKVTRTGWNGKGMWIGFMESTNIPADLVNGRTKKFFPEGDLKVQGYFAMFTANGTWAPGWLASQADMLAEDWHLLD